MKTRSQSSLTYKYLIAACLASLIISTFASYFFYNKWNEAEDRFVFERNERKMLEQNYSMVKNSFDKAFGDLMVIRDENAEVFTLHAADSTKRYIVRVYWNHYTRATFVDVLSLPVPDSLKQYQLWAISEGLPVDAGIFTVDFDPGIQQVKPVLNASGWAVTLEPKGGSAVPTIDQLCLKTKD